MGCTVASTGDGVNDNSTWRQSDCFILLLQVPPQLEQVAEIVLADNDFAHMPEVAAEGMRSINNLQRSVALILVKTVYTCSFSALLHYCATKNSLYSCSDVAAFVCKPLTAIVCAGA